MTEHEIKEKSFMIADKDNTDDKGNIVGTKNTDLGIEVFDNIENTIIELLEQQASEQKG